MKSYGKTLDALLGKCSNKAVVIVMPGCPHCTAAVQLLIDKAVPFVVVPNTSLSKATLEAMAAELKHRTYPRVFLKGKFIGGNSDLHRLLKLGKHN